MKKFFSRLSESGRNLFKNIRRIFLLAKFQYDVEVKDMFLGKLWKIISPFMQIGIYWFVFGIGIRNGAPIDGFPFVVWLTCGITPWFIMSRAILTGANSVYRKAAVLTKSNIPIYFMPISAVISVFMDALWTIALMVIIFVANGCDFSVYNLNLIYYIVFEAVFTISLSEVTSALVMLARDFYKMLTFVLRFLFYLSPIFWRPGDNMPAIYNLFNALNPIAYVVNGFRDSMLYQRPFYSQPKAVLYFWALSAVLFVIGLFCQKKIRNNLLDCL